MPYNSLINQHNSQRPARPRVAVKQIKGIGESEFDWIKKHFPDTAMTMLRNTFSITNASLSKTWLADNCTGLYYVITNSCVSFEREEDALLFKMTFDGNQSP